MSENKDNIKPRLLIIGDSFVEGVGAYDKFGWAQRFRAEVQNDISIDLSGIGGDTIEKIMARQGDYLKKKYDLVVLEVGLNDSRFRPSLGRNEVTIQVFESKITEFIDSWKSKDTNVLIVGLTRVDENKTIPYKEDKIYYNSDIEKYDKSLKCICNTAKVSYLSVPPLSDNEQSLADGIHPSTIGHEQLFSVLKDRILKSLRIWT